MSMSWELKKSLERRLMTMFSIGGMVVVLVLVFVFNSFDHSGIKRFFCDWGETIRDIGVLIGTLVAMLAIYASHKFSAARDEARDMRENALKMIEGLYRLAKLHDGLQIPPSGADTVTTREKINEARDLMINLKAIQELYFADLSAHLEEISKSVEGTFTLIDEGLRSRETNPFEIRLRNALIKPMIEKLLALVRKDSYTFHPKA